MRTLGLLGLVAAVLGATALASPWVAWGVADVVGPSFTFARVYDRVFEVLLAVGVLTSWRRLDLGSATGIGFRRQAWARELARGLAIGLAGLAVGLALLGWLLAVARLRSSGLWLPIGIHAAWVATFRVGRLFFDVRSTPAWLVGTGWPPLVGGAAGWIAVGVAAALLARRRGMFRS